MSDTGQANPGIWNAIRAKLEAAGVGLSGPSGENGEEVKVVCIAADLCDGVEELGKTSRDQVVMVRVDEATLHKLDAWVEAGIVRSRSEAAALFIREGLEVRRDELDQLSQAIQEMQEARRNLQEKARTILRRDHSDKGK